MKRTTQSLSTVARVSLCAIALAVLLAERPAVSQTSVPPVHAQSNSSRPVEERLERIEIMLNQLLRRLKPSDEAAPRSSEEALDDGLWVRGFLPTGAPVTLLSNPPGQSPETRRRVLDDLARLNAGRLAESGDPHLQTRIAQYERAYRMQAAASDLPIGTALQDWGRNDQSLPEAVPELSALRVYDRFSLNHALADGQVGQRLRVRGYVSTIRRKVEAGTTRYILQMPAEGEGAIQEPPHLHFEFQQEDRKALAAVVPGRVVTVEGVCTQPRSGEIYFTDCKLIKSDERPMEELGRP